MMRGLFLAGVVAILSACDAGSRPSPAASPTALRSVATSAPTPASDAANGISFQRPADWRVSQPNHHDPLTDGPLLYLSTDALLPECAVGAGASPHPANGQGRACDWPLTTLSPGGVLVTWATTRILQPIPSGGDVTVNGGTTRSVIERPGTCAAIGGDETIQVLVPVRQPVAWSNVAAVACLRGPNIAAAEAQFRALLASASVAR
ncbi:MAG: hypothetical protein ACJ779_12475 [Chloroflexota bacterium]